MINANLYGILFQKDLTLSFKVLPALSIYRAGRGAAVEREANVAVAEATAEEVVMKLLGSLQRKWHRYCKLPPLYRYLPKCSRLGPPFTTLYRTLRVFTVFTGN